MEKGNIVNYGDYGRVIFPFYLLTTSKSLTSLICGKLAQTHPWSESWSRYAAVRPVALQLCRYRIFATCKRGGQDFGLSHS